MSRTRLVSVLAILAVASACSDEAPPPAESAAAPTLAPVEVSAPAPLDLTPSAASERQTDKQRLLLLVDEYFEKSLQLYPVFATMIGEHRYDDRFINNLSPAHRETERTLSQNYLDALLALDETQFRGQNRLTYDVFIHNRRADLRSLQFPAHLLPLNQFYSTPNLFAQLGSGTSLQPFDSVQGYENFLGRVDGFVEWADQAITNMREGMRTGIVQPRIVMERVLPQLAAQLVAQPVDSIFYRPVTAFADSITADERKRIRVAYEQAIATKILPAYRRLHDFVAQEYLPATRETVGMNALAQGDAWYADRVANSTTTQLTAEQIHQIGLDQVAAIREDILGIMKEIGFEGDLQDFYRFLKTDSQFFFDSEEALLGAYAALKATVAENAPKLFATMPTLDFEIRPVEPFRAASAATASYQSAAPDGSRPGVFYVNTHDLRARPTYNIEAIYLHEAAPGHHFQRSLQQELTLLPRFRRFGSFTAYSEGWGLYAETLGADLGLYTDPYQRYGALSAQMLRAVRLVIDTGIHSKGWSREQALAYMRENSSLPETDAVAEVERYIAIPGQALAYKIGQLHLLKLRDDAQRRLGPHFDIRKFHALILQDGALPLDVLNAKIDRWVQPYL